MALDDRPLFLIGFMGSGKSTLGCRLSERLNWDFLDTDVLVEETAGCEIEQIFRDHGEARFREIEDGVARSLAGLTRTVVATGGGLFLSFANRRLLNSEGRTLWLDVPFETCIQRVGEGGGRPLWNPGKRLGFRALFERRRAIYALAQARLSITTEAADELVGRVLAVFD